MAPKQSVHWEGMHGRGPQLHPSQGGGEQTVQGGVALSHPDLTLCGVCM